MILKNKTVLVTGSSSGIGQAIAIEFAKGKSQVLIHYRKNKRGAEDTLKKVKKYSDGSILEADLEDPIQINSMFEKIKIDYSELDILINNAGQYNPGELGDINIWNNQFRNILLSAVVTSDKFIKMQSKDIRKIVNISSVYGRMEFPNPKSIQYSAMKAAVSNMTVALAKKHSPDILVNAVLPGYTMTPAWGKLPAEIEKELGGKTLIKRFIKATEVATMVVEIVKNDALTGQLIRVDGGLGLKE